MCQSRLEQRCRWRPSHKPGRTSGLVMDEYLRHAMHGPQIRFLDRFNLSDSGADTAGHCRSMPILGAGCAWITALHALAAGVVPSMISPISVTR